MSEQPAPPRLTMYADASFADRWAGIAIVCTSLGMPWLAQAKRIKADTSTHAEAEACRWAIEWAEGLPVTVFTDCDGIVRRPATYDLPPYVLVKIRRNTHPAHDAADTLASWTRRMPHGRHDVPLHRLGMPEHWLPVPRPVLVRWPSGQQRIAALLRDDGKTGFVRIVGRKSPAKVPRAWINFDAGVPLPAGWEKW